MKPKTKSIEMNINCLNDDCLTIIFSLIPLKQLLVDRQVCTHWRQRIDNYVFNSRHFVYNQTINKSKRDQYFYKYKENVESLMDLNQFQCYVQLMPKITSITLNGIKANDAMITLLANNCPNITKMHFMSGEESLTFIGYKYLVEKYPLLTHLDLPNCQLDDDLVHIIATNLQNLVHFNFGTDRSRGVRTCRLSRFTGQTLRKVGHKVRSLMIGESMYWDELLIQSLIQSNARHVTTLKIHLIKLKALPTICDNMTQLRKLYLSFNGGDINTQDNNVGCIRHLRKLHDLEVLELIDDGRHHCGINGCHSVYTLNTLMEAIRGLTHLKVLKLLDFDNWHSIKPNIDPFLSELKSFCPKLVDFGISAGLFQLKAESYGLIALLDTPALTLQGDTSLQEMPNTSKHNYSTNEMLIDLFKTNKSLVSLKVENCPLIGDDAITGCLALAAERHRQRIAMHFSNTRLNSCHLISAKIPENVTLIITKEDDVVIDLDDYTDGSSFSDSSYSESIHLFSGEDDDDIDVNEHNY